MGEHDRGGADQRAALGQETGEVAPRVAKVQAAPGRVGDLGEQRLGLQGLVVVEAGAVGVGVLAVTENTDFALPFGECPAYSKSLLSFAKDSGGAQRVGVLFFVFFTCSLTIMW
jgi:hypothetical protein